MYHLSSCLNMKEQGQDHSRTVRSNNPHAGPPLEAMFKGDTCRGALTIPLYKHY